MPTTNKKGGIISKLKWIIPLFVLLTPTLAIAEPNTDNIVNKIQEVFESKTEPLGDFPVGDYTVVEKPIKTQPVAPKVVITSNQALAEIIRRESTNNMYAINPSSGACGLGQSLPCSKMLNWIGVSSLQETTYDQQLAWVKMYISSRYGTPEAALLFHNQNGWY